MRNFLQALRDGAVTALIVGAIVAAVTIAAAPSFFGVVFLTSTAMAAVMTWTIAFFIVGTVLSWVRSEREEAQTEAFVNGVVNSVKDSFDKMASSPEAAIDAVKRAKAANAAKKKAKAKTKAEKPKEE